MLGEEISGREVRKIQCYKSGENEDSFCLSVVSGESIKGPASFFFITNDMNKDYLFFFFFGQICRVAHSSTIY